MLLRELWVLNNMPIKKRYCPQCKGGSKVRTRGENRDTSIPYHWKD